MADSFNYEEKNILLSQIKKFISSVDHVYLTTCMDVFASAYAPGVSATAANGIAPDFVFLSCFDLIAKSKKLISFDVVETNPKFDVDGRTAKLAASLVFRVL
jgi:formiminoglutamase